MTQAIRFQRNKDQGIDSREHEQTFGLFQVHALLRDGKKVTLFSSLQEPDEGRFIEQKIEAYLRIPDQRVEGEWE